MKTLKPSCPAKCEEVLSKKVELVNVTSHSIAVVERIKAEKAQSTFIIRRCALLGLINLSDLEEYARTDFLIPKERLLQDASKPLADVLMHKNTDDANIESFYHQSLLSHNHRNESCKTIFFGLMCAVLCEELKDKAMIVIKGLIMHDLFLYLLEI